MWTVLFALVCAQADSPRVDASSIAPGAHVDGPLDADLLDTSPASCWRGRERASAWWWSVQFDRLTPVGAIFQVVGSDAEVFRDAPRDYAWQATVDGVNWQDLPTTITKHETRLFRLHRFDRPHVVLGLRMSIRACTGLAPVLRGLRFLPAPDTPLDFPPWILAVSTVEAPDSLQEAAPFVRLARRSPGGRDLSAQLLWMGDLDPDFVNPEPRPLCVFLSGNFNDWCQKERAHWKGIEAILARAQTPIWASCGGAQGLAILATAGTRKPWDCPRCRDPRNPLLPIYTHIGHTGTSPCGVYERNVAERGPTQLRIVAPDPALAGLPETFVAMESHVGQIAYVPPGWTLLVADGPGALTHHQLIRLNDRPIYAAQFHIEMEGAPAASERIMTNFLEIARAWSQRRESVPRRITSPVRTLRTEP